MIVFVDYLYKEIGGVGQLVVNTIAALNERGLTAKVYCSKEAYEYKQLVVNENQFVFVDSDKISLSQLCKYIDPEDVIFLTHINNTPLLESIKSNGNRILFYSVHPDTFFVYNRYLDFLFNQKKAALNLVSVLQDKDALAFMDTSNVEGVNRRGANLNANNLKYLPIPIYCGLKKRSKRVGINVLNITYLGRGNADWKIFPILKVIKDLQLYAVGIKLTIITDKTDMFETMIAQCIPNNALTIVYKTDLSGVLLMDYLVNQSDIHISMGTSALEGARLGIPTILIDYSYQSFPDNYQYKWLFESNGFSLGNDISNKQFFEGHLIGEIIDDINNDSTYDCLSERCYQYVQKNHSIDSYIRGLLTLSERSSMTVADYCETRFSKNMKYFLPIILGIGSVKRFFFRTNISLWHTTTSTGVRKS